MPAFISSLGAHNQWGRHRNSLAQMIQGDVSGPSRLVEVDGIVAGAQDVNTGVDEECLKGSAVLSWV